MMAMFFIFPMKTFAVYTHYVPPNRREGGHIVFGADPVGVSVRIASFPCVIL